MTQWGSKALGDQGYSAIEILRSFYGNDMYINVAEAVSGIPASWPGYDLTIGVTGEKVQQIQEQLNAIAKAILPSVSDCGWYLWSGYRCICKKIPEYIRASCIRSGGLSNLV